MSTYSIFRFLIIFFASIHSLSGFAQDKKPICVLYGSCQMISVHEFLKYNYPDLYEYTYVVSYRVISGEDAFDKNIFQDADLFIYQPVNDSYGEKSITYIKNNLLKSTCALVSFPHLNFLGYFPDFVNRKDDPTPFEKLNEWLSKGYTVKGIIDISKKDNFLTLQYIQEKIEYSLQILKNYELETDISISDYIENNYRNVRLFHTFNHPTNVLLKEVIRRLMVFMHFPTDNIDHNPIFKKEILGGHTFKIYPCIYKFLALKFPFENRGGYNNISYDDYIRDLLTKKSKEFDPEAGQIEYLLPSF